MHKINKLKLNIQNSRKSYLQTIFTKIMFKKFQWKYTDRLGLLGYGKFEFRSPVNLACTIRNPGLYNPESTAWIPRFKTVLDYFAPFILNPPNSLSLELALPYISIPSCLYKCVNNLPTSVTGFIRLSQKRLDITTARTTYHSPEKWRQGGFRA